MGPVVGKKGDLRRSLWEAEPGVWTRRWEGCRAPLRDDKHVSRGVGCWHDQNVSRESPQRKGTGMWRDLGRTRKGWKLWILEHCYTGVQGPPCHHRAGGNEKPEVMEWSFFPLDVRITCFRRKLNSMMRPTTCGPWLSSWPSTERPPSGQAWCLRPSVSVHSTSLNRTSPTTTR